MSDITFVKLLDNLKCRRYPRQIFFLTNYPRKIQKKNPVISLLLDGVTLSSYYAYKDFLNIHRQNWCQCINSFA